MGPEVLEFSVRTAAEYRAAFDAMRDAHFGGVVIASSPFLPARWPKSLRLRSSNGCRRSASGAYGGLRLSHRLWSRSGRVVRAHSGFRRPTLCWRQPGRDALWEPTHFEMAINTSIAAAIGIELLFAHVARADEVIEY
jgi:hypothetical protein